MCIRDRDKLADLCEFLEGEALSLQPSASSAGPAEPAQPIAGRALGEAQEQQQEQPEQPGGGALASEGVEPDV
eukprot:4226101-Alexandrium_andersonii.AAC.2